MEKINQRLIVAMMRSCKKLVSGIVPALVFCLWTGNVAAQSLNLISDEETEQLLAQITRPLFKAAGVSFNRNNIYIVDDASLNAFVADGNNLFVHTGTILAADDANELSGVIAHETGHIEGGHILRQKLKSQALNEVTLASAILAGTAAVLSGRGDAAMAVMLGAQSSALTSYTAYRTEQERSADEAAMKLLDQTKQSPEGMLRFMKKISQQNTLNGIEEMPYFRSHPITRERISFFEEAVKKSPYGEDNSLQTDFERVKAKLYAYLNTPQSTYQKYPLSDHSTTAQYARSIADFKNLKFAQALEGLSRLIKAEPQNPYFHELKGQIYLETGKIKEAKTEYQKALHLMPQSTLLQINMAQAILEDAPSPKDIQTAVNLLNKAQIARPAGFSWLLLARAYGMKGDQAAAIYAAAEYSLRIGAEDTARRQAMQAKQYHPNPKLALKIDDLLSRLDSLKKKS